MGNEASNEIIILLLKQYPNLFSNELINKLFTESANHFPWASTKEVAKFILDKYPGYITDEVYIEVFNNQIHDSNFANLLIEKNPGLILPSILKEKFESLINLECSASPTLAIEACPTLPQIFIEKGLISLSDVNFLSKTLVKALKGNLEFINYLLGRVDIYRRNTVEIKNG